MQAVSEENATVHVRQRYLNHRLILLEVGLYAINGVNSQR